MRRRVRAILSTTLLWGLVWFPMGIVLGLYAASFPPQPSDVISRPVSLPLFSAAWTAWGGLSGGVFALVLGFAERRRSFEHLSLARTAIWGALGAMTLPALLTLLDVLRTPAGVPGYGWRFPLLALSISATLGAGCAGATLAFARRSPT